MAGATTREIMETAGHKTMSQSARYSHLSPQHTQSVVDRIAIGTRHAPIRQHSPEHAPGDSTFSSYKQFLHKSVILLVPGGGVEPPRGCPRRILSPYLLQIRDLRLYYLKQLTGCDDKVPCGPVRGYFGTLDIVLGIVSRNGFPADLPMPKTSTNAGLRCFAPQTPPNTLH